YTPIEHAISKGIRYFNPGMSGEHKVHRGFCGTLDSSFLWLPDLRLDLLFRGNIAQFNDYASEQAANHCEQSPLEYCRQSWRKNQTL
ncbi:MAG: hypothetical protein D6B26_04525, partial [Spirochaetaceae bacterium]